MNDDLRCSKCGYSQEDANLHGDYHLCSGAIPNDTEELHRILQERFDANRPVAQDVAIHAFMLVSNGWKAKEALDESQRTLDEAEMEGGY